MKETKIAWTESTWNPIRGCSPVSEGCANCYAARQACRFSKEGEPYHGLAKMTESGPRWTGKVRLIEDHLLDPIKWTRSRMIFVNSMSDLFHPSLATEDIDRIFGVMRMAAPRQHVFQVLTKRPDVMKGYLTNPETPGRIAKAMLRIAADILGHPPATCFEAKMPRPYIWLGTTCENQARYDERVDLLQATPADVRFLSVEPMLGPIDLGFPRQGIHWVIVGSESGPHARPMDEDWVRSIRDQCVKHGVAFFYKQCLDKKGKKVEVPMLDGQRWDQYPG